MRKFLHVSIIWRGSAKSALQLKPIFDLADDWITYGGNNWIVYTAEGTGPWQGRIMAVISLEVDHFFISEIADVYDTAGYLPQWVWDWLRQPRTNSPTYGMLLAPIKPVTEY